MYEEIIAALRFCDNGECDGCCKYIKGKGTGCYTLLRDAADAIEELQKQVLEWQTSRDLERSLCSVMEMQIPRWIPVTERLPSEKDRYLTVSIEPWFGTTVVDTMRWSGVWMYDGRQTEATVTHWMPLPEPTKEGT